jgi:hypothetical protein
MRRLEDMTEPELRTLLHTLASQIVATATTLGVEKPLFALVLFNDPKLGQYVSNGTREDVIKGLRECADRLEHHEDVER